MIIVFKGNKKRKGKVSDMRNFFKRTGTGFKGFLIFAVIVVVAILGFSNMSKASADSQAEKVADYALSQVGTRERRAGSDNVFYNDWYYGRTVSNRYSGQYSWCHVLRTEADIIPDHQATHRLLVI